MKITINESDLADFHFLLSGIESGADKALSRALNKGVDGVGPEIKTIVQSTHNIKSTTITGQIRKQKASPQHLRAKVTVGQGAYGRGKGTAIIDFAAGRATRRSGYRVKLKKNKGIVTLANAFVATMKSGHKGVFVRVGYTNLYSRENGSPSARKEAIKEVFSTSTVDALKNPGNYATLRAKVIARINNELARQTDLLLSRF
ncbi:MAG: flagellar basal body-associated FliL family protein [Desulfobulbales bacterium]|nr:flagellar basal body-associated FliL family protein [Desulfobulbales bacterium]